MGTDLTFIQKKLKSFYDMGFIKASEYIEYRVGDTGEFGRLVEKLFDVQENNFATPDLGEIELKSQVLESKSKITIGTKKPIKGLTTQEQFERFKYKTANGKYRFYQSITTNQNKNGFSLSLNDDSIDVFHYNDYISSYIFDLNIKAPKVLFVFGEKRGSKDSAEYHIKEAFLAQEPKNIHEFIKTNHDLIQIDIRCGVKKLSQKAKLVLDFLKTNTSIDSFTAANLSEMIGHKISPQTLNSIAKKGFLTKLETLPVVYRVVSNTEALYEYGVHDHGTAIRCSKNKILQLFNKNEVLL